MSGPLNGLRVLDLSHALAGPMCTYQLQLLGADVIKVERPGGDAFRNYTEHSGASGMSGPFVAVNGGKRSIVLDLTDPLGAEAVRRLASTADVVVENFRPGVARSLNVDHDTLRALDPRLIYCSITGFGQAGPLHQRPAYDHIVQAMSGMMSVNGVPGGDPTRVGLPVADVFAGYVGAYAVLAALVQRTSTGLGQHVDVSMLDASMVLMAPFFAGFYLNGTVPQRTGNKGFRLVASSDTYATSDGFLAIGANHQAQFERLCEVLGAPELPRDSRFTDHVARVRHAEDLHDALAALIGKRKARELEDALTAREVPAARVRDIAETAGEPHVRDRGNLLDVALASAGDQTSVVGTGFLAESMAIEVRAPVPRLGEHTTEILREIGLAEADVV